jgi:hypothetical protein
MDKFMNYSPSAGTGNIFFSTTAVLNLVLNLVLYSNIFEIWIKRW